MWWRSWEKWTAEGPEVGAVKSSVDDLSGQRSDRNRAGKILGWST